MQYIPQLNSCAPLLPVNFTVNVRRFYNSVASQSIVEQKYIIIEHRILSCTNHVSALGEYIISYRDTIYIAIVDYQGVSLYIGSIREPIYYHSLALIIEQ